MSSLRLLLFASIYWIITSRFHKKIITSKSGLFIWDYTSSMQKLNRKLMQRKLEISNYGF